MKSLYFEHENKKKKANLVITLVALFTLICIGFGCSQVMTQTGDDTSNHIVIDINES